MVNEIPDHEDLERRYVPSKEELTCGEKKPTKGVSSRLLCLNSSVQF